MGFLYGAYAYRNVDGTGPIVRMKSSYTLNSGTTRALGPNVSATYPLGYFREDYQYTANSSANPDYLDEHNGRFCITPEYPNGIYCYFATVNEKWNSTYPYVVGPTFYGIVAPMKVTTVPAGTSVYTPSASILTELNDALIKIFSNPISEVLVIQLVDINTENLNVELFDLNGKQIAKTQLLQGSTLAYFDTKLIYSGTYVVRISIMSAPQAGR